MRPDRPQRDISRRLWKARTHVCRQLFACVLERINTMHEFLSGKEACRKMRTFSARLHFLSVLPHLRITSPFTKTPRDPVAIRYFHNNVDNCLKYVSLRDMYHVHILNTLSHILFMYWI